MYINTNFLNDFIMDELASDEQNAWEMVVYYFGRNIFGLRDADKFYL